MTRLPIAHERRVIRRLEARGEPGLGEALVLLDGSLVGGRFRIVSLYAVGSEGAVYLARDEGDRKAPLRVAKVAALPVHRPFDLTDADVARRRAALREEAENLSRAGTAHLPKCLGLFDVRNPALEPSWGGEFAAPEPCLVMEKLPGFDLDLWLARVHSSSVPRNLLRRHLDHVAVVVLTALMELQDRGYYYTDLRPGNIRIRGRSKERVRLMDAGSLVRSDDRSGKFPHVPAYLPCELFATSVRGGRLTPTPAVEAAMAGRTLFEVATARVPRPGEPVDLPLLQSASVSPAVAETIERLCTGDLADVTSALTHLSERIRRESVSRGAAALPQRTAARAAAPRGDAPAPGALAARSGAAPPAASVRDLHSLVARSREAAAAPAAAAAVADAPARAEPPHRTSAVGAAAAAATARARAARPAGGASSPAQSARAPAVLPPPRRGFLGRIIDRLLGRG